MLGELITDLALLGSLGLASACLYYSPCTFLLSCFFLTLRHLDAPLFLSFVRAWLDLSEPRAVALDTHLVFSCLGHIPLSISIFCSTAQNTAKMATTYRGIRRCLPRRNFAMLATDFEPLLLNAAAFRP